MKTILFVLTLHVSSAHARDLICKPSTIRAVYHQVTRRTCHEEELRSCERKRIRNDKNLHCAVSCVLTLKCFPSDVLIIGLGKEIYDCVSPGDADIRDLEADYRGVHLVSSGRARNTSDCYQQCDSYYPIR